MITVSRAGWGAVPPTSITPLNRSRVVNFIIHYSGASRDQTVRSIQRFCMENKGHSDIDYNDLVRGQNRYVGRGWNIGSHTLNNNSNGYGVCVIGNDGDATDDDLRTVRDIYEEVCATLGRRINITDHRNLLGASYTSCPGNKLDAWVDAGMPSPSGGNMGDIAGFAENANNHGYAITQLDPAYEVRPSNVSSAAPVTIENLFIQKFLTLVTDVAELKVRPPVASAPVDINALVAALRPVIRAEAEAAVRAVAQDAGTP